MSVGNEIIIKICMGSSCFARGNNKNLDAIEKFLEQNNIDANIELIGSRCEGECSSGPHISINENHYNNVDASELDMILKENLLLVDR